MLLAAEALGVDLVNFFRTRRPGCEPSVLSDYLHPTDRLAVSWSVSQDGLDLFASQSRTLDALFAQLAQNRFLLGGRVSVRPVILRITILLSQLLVDLARILL